MRYYLTPVRMALLSIRQVITTVGELVEKRKPSFTAVLNVNW